MKTQVIEFGPFTTEGVSAEFFPCDHPGKVLGSFATVNTAAGEAADGEVFFEYQRYDESQGAWVSVVPGGVRLKAPGNAGPGSVTLSYLIAPYKRMRVRAYGFVGAGTSVSMMITVTYRFRGGDPNVRNQNTWT